MLVEFAGSRVGSATVSEDSYVARSARTLVGLYVLWAEDWSCVLQLAEGSVSNSSSGIDKGLRSY